MARARSDTPETSRIEDLLGCLEREPGATQLLALAPPGAFLVGGAVRDLLLGRRPRELDVVLAGAGEGGTSAGAVSRLARELAEWLGAGGKAERLGAGGEEEKEEGVGCSIEEPAARARARTGAQEESVDAAANEHPRFDTAVVEWAGGRIDIAAARRERYPHSAALPEVEPAPLAEDLLRRDFTANAIAIGLVGEERGALRAAPHALEDLDAHLLRVLHEQSFLDDPTRLWRMVRYRARLGFAVEPHTAELAAQAVTTGALAEVSGARLGAELRLALTEPDPLAALAAADDLGLLAALHPRLRLEAELVGRALGLLGVGRSRADSRAVRSEGFDVDAARPDVLMLASLLLALTLRADSAREADRGVGPDRGVGADRGVEAVALLDRLEFGALVRDRVVAAALAVPRLVDVLAQSLRPSQLRAAVLGVPPEGVALAGALSDSAADAARRWLSELCRVRLRIDGHDLLAGGVAEGPDVGRRLEAVLRRRLDGELPDERDAQLRAALAG